MSFNTYLGSSTFFYVHVKRAKLCINLYYVILHLFYFFRRMTISRAKKKAMAAAALSASKRAEYNGGCAGMSL
jgi:hypothetical protein